MAGKRILQGLLIVTLIYYAYSVALTAENFELETNKTMGFDGNGTATMKAILGENEDSSCGRYCSIRGCGHLCCDITYGFCCDNDRRCWCCL